MLDPPVRSRLQDLTAAALTFDDGPDPTFTPQVLDVLAELDVRATFFLVGHRARAHPALVRRIFAEGHAVGSHSFSHPEPGTLGWRVVRDFRRGRRAVEAAAGQRVPLFRPPKGYVGREERVGMAAARADPWLWTIDPEDWRPGATAAEIVRGLRSLGGGDVVLLHDGICGPLTPEAEDRSATVEALPEIVALAAERSVQLVPLPTS